MTPALICPACRRIEAGVLRIEELHPHDEGLGCVCGAWYPVIDGIPVVVRNLEEWLASEGAELVRRPDVPRRLVQAIGGALARNQHLVESYARPLPSPLRSWLAEHVATLPRPVVELGAGLGHPDTLALDLNFALLRARGGGVVADAADPPLRAESARSVVIANLLDACRQPALVLAQADALLAPGGTMIITCPYAFHDTITPPAARFTADQLRGALQGASWFGYRLATRLVEERDGIAWRLRTGPRAETVFQVHVLVGQKPE